MIAGTDAKVHAGILLAGWLPGDKQDEERLLAWVLDDTHGQVAEEGLAVRIVLGTSDPGLRRRRLLAVTEAAYARRALLSVRVRPTPYDDAAPIEQLQSGAVERLIAAGRVDQACELSVRFAVPVVRLGRLREALGECIRDRHVPAEARLRLIGYAEKIHPGLVGELRRERGLAVDPLPTFSAWSALAGPARTLASLTVSPEAVHSALEAAEVSRVVVALEMARGLASVAPKEAVGFAA
ncbi:MAG: hypothetical protein NT154_18780, partial [Verrucomicrobia bacterium]|nr:hypothetical protein [Verrucomicrobiota bacterium]